MLKRELAIVVLVVAVGGCSKKEDSAATAASASAASAADKPLASAASTAAIAPFEGRIILSLKGESGHKLPATITYDIKGDKVRYAPESTDVRTIGDLAAQHAYAIDDGKKTYREIDTTSGADAGKAADAKVGKTGKKETIAGLDCEDWTIDGGDEKADVCVAKGIAFFDLARDPKPGGMEPSWASPLTREKAFPLRVVVHDKSGKEQFRAEASVVIPKKLDDTLFQVPTGFKKGEVDVKSASLP